MINASNPACAAAADLYDIKRKLEKASDEIKRGDPEQAAHLVDLALSDVMTLIGQSRGG